MKTTKLFLLQVIFILSFWLNSFYSWASDWKGTNENLTFVGCTPGDNLIKSQLGISSGTMVDFIKWNLIFDSSNHFVLNINFGESQPNTLGFKSGGQNKNLLGTYAISKSKGIIIYHLKTDHSQLAFIRLNDNLLHVLSPQNQLRVGNGGYSYTLNNANPTKNNNAIPTLITSRNSENNNYAQVIYEGRTPCQDFAAEHQMSVSQSCFKLKWKLILNRDSISHSPTTYTIRKVVDNMPKDISGNWTIVKGVGSNQDAIIYVLDGETPNQKISLFVADENILFFLHRDKNLFVGNDNFSFTLNKRANSDK